MTLGPVSDDLDQCGDGARDLGVIRRDGDTATITFQRRYAKPLEKVWAAITLPERLADWFCEIEIEALRPGAPVSLYFPDTGTRAVGEIRIYEPMQTVAWTWRQPDGSESLVRFDLAPEDGGCRLTLTESGLTLDEGATNAAGWHAHLDGLGDAAEGDRTPWAVLLEREALVVKRYRAMLAALTEPTGA